MEGLYTTDLCKDKIAVNSQMVAEMELSKKECQLKLSVTPIYKTTKCHSNYATLIHGHYTSILMMLGMT